MQSPLCGIDIRFGKCAISVFPFAHSIWQGKKTDLLKPCGIGEITHTAGKLW